MKQHILFCFALCFTSSFLWAQEHVMSIHGTVQNAADDKNIENVHIINLNSVKGAITNEKGEFSITAHVNDTIYFSYLGFKPLKTRVTNDWVKYGNVKVKMTELGIALQEVIIAQNKLTGFLEIDAKNIPVYTNDSRYSISGLNTAYEGGNSRPNAVSRTLNTILNPVTSVYKIFARKNVQLRKLRKVKEDDEIRNLLQSKFDRETLTTLLQIEKVDIDEILNQCNYSKTFIKTANDLQILDAISECYEEYKILNR